MTMHKQIWKEIAKYLNFPDLLGSFARLDDEFRNISDLYMSSTDLVEEFNNYLSSLLSNTCRIRDIDWLMNWLKNQNSNAVLSGSIVQSWIQYRNDKHQMWQPGDLDFFLTFTDHASAMKTWENFLNLANNCNQFNEYELESTPCRRRAVTNKIYRNSMYHSIKMYRELKVIDREHRRILFKFQLIWVYDEKLNSLNDYIDYYFDLPHLKFSYNGNKLHFSEEFKDTYRNHYGIMIPSIPPLNPNTLSSLVTTFGSLEVQLSKLIRASQNSLRRLNKYIDRGVQVEIYFNNNIKNTLSIDKYLSNNTKNALSVDKYPIDKYLSNNKPRVIMPCASFPIILLSEEHICILQTFGTNDTIPLNETKDAIVYTSSDTISDMKSDIKSEFKSEENELKSDENEEMEWRKLNEIAANDERSRQNTINIEMIAETEEFLQKSKEKKWQLQIERGKNKRSIVDLSSINNHVQNHFFMKNILNFGK